MIFDLIILYNYKLDVLISNSMDNKKKIVLIGGFCEIIEALIEDNYIIEGVVDLVNNSAYRYCGDDDHYMSNGSRRIPILISPDKPAIRERLYNLYHNEGFSISTFVHSTAYLSSSSIVGEGCFIQRMVHISSNVKIGKGSRINAMVNIMHHSQVGEFSTIAPNAVILGYVKIGNNCYIGANATVLPHIEICDHVTIGAGAVVTKSIQEPFTTYAGVPARCIKRR